MNRNVASLLLFCATFLVAPSAASAVTIDTVPVGNRGNANDPATGNLYGGVAYDYRIGTTEVTVGQYTAFLNAVAATDTYALYDTQMYSDFKIHAIERFGASGSYSYAVMGSPMSPNHPVTYVSWGDAARFANWLHNGQPTGAQSLSTTESGAYFLNGATSSAALNAVSRSSGATWVIPSESEWYKAAYHQPAVQGGDVDNYWTYPTRTNAEPDSDQPPGDPNIQRNVANFYRDDGQPDGYSDGYAVNGSTSWPGFGALTEAGAYTSARSPYGTFDQAGNVYEWNEALRSSSSRGMRGGSWGDVSLNLRASSRNNLGASDQSAGVGFRVAFVPEPSSFVLAALGVIGLVVWRRRKR
jgi:formylglycine-generating enzyme required for sulfatase activity